MTAVTTGPSLTSDAIGVVSGAGVTDILVDVVIPCRSPVPWLAVALQSVLESAPGLVAWVVDDGSSDNAVADCVATLRDPRLHYLRQDAAGPSAARNTGLRSGTAPWVVFLDADDFFLPGGLDMLLAAGQRSSGMVLAGWQDVAVDSRLVLATHRPDHGTRSDALSTMLFIAPPAGPVLLPRADIAWDESRRVWEVTRYFNRVAARVGSLTVLPDPVAAIRQHDSVNRLSHTERHFELDVASAFWIEEYAWLCTLGVAGRAGRQIVAKRLLGLAYAGARAGDSRSRRCAAAILALSVRDDWQSLLTLRTGSAAWVATRFGLAGLSAFATANRWIGR